jgi:hypothetical protein
VSLELHSTWADPQGHLWTIDHKASKDSWAMHPDWVPEYQVVVVTESTLLTAWQYIESATQRRERMKRQRELRCERGYHADPDHSGLCIHCGAEL